MRGGLGDWNPFGRAGSTLYWDRGRPARNEREARKGLIIVAVYLKGVVAVEQCGRVEHPNG